MLWAALSYSSGIVAGVYAWRPALLWSLAAAAFLAAAAYFVRRRIWIAAALALGGFFIVGALHIQLWAPGNRLDLSILPYTDGQQLQITAHVTRDGRLRDGNFGELQQTIDVEAGDALVVVRGFRQLRRAHDVAQIIKSMRCACLHEILTPMRTGLSVRLH